MFRGPSMERHAARELSTLLTSKLFSSSYTEFIHVGQAN